MTTPYKIDGPVDIGDSGQNSSIYGNVFLPNVGGDQNVLYTNSSNEVLGLAPGTEGQVLSIVGGSLAWASSAEASGFGFASYDGTVSGINGTDKLLTTWSTSAPGYDTTSGAFDSATGVFTVPVGGTGYYLITGTVTYSSVNCVGQRVVTAMKNGTTPLRSSFSYAAPRSADLSSLTVTIVSSLAAGDTVGIYIKNTSGSSTTIANSVAAPAGTSFAIVRMK